MLTAHALLLDMDGTLVDSHAVVHRVWRRWCADHGFDFEPVLARANGRQGHAVMAELLPDRPVEQNLAENATLLAAEIADVDGVVEVPGAAGFLAAIAGFPHAMVTSATIELATRRLTAAGLIRARAAIFEKTLY